MKKLLLQHRHRTTQNKIFMDSCNSICSVVWLTLLLVAVISATDNDDAMYSKNKKKNVKRTKKWIMFACRFLCSSLWNTLRKNLMVFCDFVRWKKINNKNTRAINNYKEMNKKNCKRLQTTHILSTHFFANNFFFIRYIFFTQWEIKEANIVQFRFFFFVLMLFFGLIHKWIHTVNVK